MIDTPSRDGMVLLIPSRTRTYRALFGTGSRGLFRRDDPCRFAHDRSVYSTYL